MNPDRGRVILVMSGIVAGALTASLVSWAPLPRAALVGAVAATVAALAGAVLRPRAAS